MARRLDDVDLARDRVLVELHQGGDDAAFEDLYRRYYGRLYRFCLKRVGDSHEAEELTQETFTRAYRALPSLRGERRFYPWLSVIASRLCVDTHRRLGRTEPSPDIDLGTVDGGHERRVEDDADRALLRAALARLAPRHREVLELREGHGWSYQRIADHYDLSMAAVEALLFRARQSLRREFTVVAGPDSGVAAGVPVLGWLFRRLQMAWLNTPALAGSAMGVAMAVTTAAGLCAAVAPSLHHQSSVSVAAAAPAAAVRPLATDDAPATAPAVPPSAHSPADHGSRRAAAPPATQPSDVGGTAYQRPLLNASQPGPAAARQRAEDTPVNTDGHTGPVAAGADPDEISQAVAADTARYLDQSKGRLP